jgi:iron complex transport system ATP-binding protein
MSDVLEFAGVSVVRGDNTLLDNITWEVEEGQRWVILGPNGAGKTTLLAVAAGRIHPTTGVAGVLGEVLGAVDVFELRPRIGLSSAAMAERLPADELVRDVVVTASYGIVGRWREAYDALDHARAANLLEALGAAHLSERAFGTLSEGERKRVQIARALMTDPELMLLDEPAAGLDLGGREELVARLGALAADIDAPALVLVTHHVEEIPPSFTDVLLMREGRIIAAGPVEIILTAANLSETFGLPLVLERHGDRWSARAAGNEQYGMGSLSTGGGAG